MTDDCWRLKHRESDGRIVAVDPESGTAKPLVISENDLDGSDIVGVGALDAESIAVGGGQTIQQIEFGVVEFDGIGAASDGQTGTFANKESTVAYSEPFDEPPIAIASTADRYTGLNANSAASADSMDIVLQNFSTIDNNNTIPVHYVAIA